MKRTPMKRGKPLKRTAFKKSSKAKPKKKSRKISGIKKKCDQARSRIVRSHGRCEMCPRDGSQYQLHDHHPIGRGALFYRYDFRNAMCLCAQCHTLDNECSAHSGIRAFSERMAAKHPAQSKWWDDHRHTLNYGHKPDYAQILAGLLEIEKQIEAGQMTFDDLRDWREE